MSLQHMHWILEVAEIERHRKQTSKRIAQRALQNYVDDDSDVIVMLLVIVNTSLSMALQPLWNLASFSVS